MIDEIPVYTGVHHNLYAYLAGCVDCDGWISEKGKNGYLVGLTQHIQLWDDMVSIQSDLINDGINARLYERTSRTGLGNTLMCNLIVQKTTDLLILLPRIIPYLRFKKQKAIDAYVSLCKHSDLNANESDNNMKGSKRKYWNQKEIEELIRLHSEGYNNPAIGIKMNRSTDSVSHKLYRLGIVRNE